MITTNQADRILNQKGSSRYYKRLEVEELHRLLILLAEIEITNLGDEYFIKKQFNPHNQFLDFYLSSGLIAVILFLILYSLLFFQSKYSYYKMALFISNLVLIIESYLSFPGMEKPYLAPQNLKLQHSNKNPYQPYKSKIIYWVFIRITFRLMAI